MSFLAGGTLCVLRLIYDHRPSNKPEPLHNDFWDTVEMRLRNQNDEIGNRDRYKYPDRYCSMRLGNRNDEIGKREKYKYPDRYVCLLLRQRVEGLRPEMRWPGNKQLIERLRDMTPTICDQEQLSKFHGSRDMKLQFYELSRDTYAH